jgi:hypothetical protein
MMKLWVRKWDMISDGSVLISCRLSDFSISRRYQTTSGVGDTCL